MRPLRSYALLPLVSLTLLGGCLATTDLASESSPLDEDHRDVARRIGYLTATTCVVTLQRGDKPVGTQVVIVKPLIVKRLYAADPDWFKAVIAGQRAWDDIYWNRHTDELVCGASEWAKMPESTTLVFEEITGSTGR